MSAVVGLGNDAKLELGTQMAQTGYFDTTFYGSPITMPQLVTIMHQWMKEVCNQSVLSLVNQGDNSPQALAAECLAVAQDYINLAEGFVPPIPDANLSTALPFSQQIQAEAGYVPAVQWNAATYSVNLPGTIAEALKATSPTPPPAPASPIMVGACTFMSDGSTRCVAGPGSTVANTTDGEVVTNPDGSKYTAHVTQFLMGPELWFSPLP